MNNGAAPAGPIAASAPLPRRATLPLWRLGSWVGTHAANPRRLIGLILATLVLVAGSWLLGWRVYGWHHLRAGDAALQVDHCRVALEHFQASLRVWPEDAEVLFLTARAARRSGDLAAAESCLSRCETALAVADRALLERVLLRATRGELDAVEHFCHAQLDQEHPDTPLILEALAQGAITALRFPEAFYYLERWLALAPDQPQALLLKGQLQSRSGNQQEALALFGRVLELDPERDDARLQLATQYLELVQADKAQVHLDWLRRRLPGNAMVEVESARCLDLLGEQEAARRLLDDVLARQPLLAAALLERGRLALRTQELDDAEHYLRAACKRDPGSYEAHYKLMQCLRGQEEHAGNAALKKTKHAEADAALEKANRVRDDGVRLRAIATGALSLRPRDPALHAEIGDILLRLGHLEQGQRWLESALQIDPRHPDANRALAQYYQSLGQSGKAERHRMLGAAADPAKARQ